MLYLNRFKFYVTLIATRCTYPPASHTGLTSHYTIVLCACDQSFLHGSTAEFVAFH